jgi:hypothetical protein
MASFFVRAASRPYELGQPDQLLRLLVVMTRHKLSKQERRHRAGKRDYRLAEDRDPGVPRGETGSPTRRRAGWSPAARRAAAAGGVPPPLPPGRGAVALDDAGPIAGPAARFSPDGRRIALRRCDGTTLIYDLASGQPCGSWPGPASGGDLAFRADGGRIASIHNTKGTFRCRIVESETGHQIGKPIRLPSSGAWVAGGPAVPPWRRSATIGRAISGTPSPAGGRSSPKARPTAGGIRPFTLRARYWPATVGKAGCGSGIRCWAVPSVRRL